MRQHTLRGRAEHTATHRCGTIKSLYLLLVRPTGGLSPQKGCRVPAVSRQGRRSVAATGVGAGHSPSRGRLSQPGGAETRHRTRALLNCFVYPLLFWQIQSLWCPLLSRSHQLNASPPVFPPRVRSPSSTHTNWQLKFNIFSRGKTISEIKPVMVANCPSGSRRFPREPGRVCSLWCGCRGCPGRGQ